MKNNTPLYMIIYIINSEKYSGPSQENEYDFSTLPCSTISIISFLDPGVHTLKLPSGMGIF